MNFFWIFLGALNSLPRQRPKTKEIIVECNRENEKLISQIGVIKHKIPMINSYVVEIPESDIHKIEGQSGITAVHENTHITAQMRSTRERINADAASVQKLSGNGVTIAILDTGLSPVNDFVQPFNRIIAFKDFINGKKAAYDDNGHGTHVWCASS